MGGIPVSWGLWWSRQGTRSGRGRSDFKAFHRSFKQHWVATVCFQVGSGQQRGQTTFTSGLFLPELYIRLEWPFGFSSSLSILGLSHNPYLVPGICQCPPDQERISQCHKSLSPQLSSPWISAPHTRFQGQTGEAWHSFLKWMWSNRGLRIQEHWQPVLFPNSEESIVPPLKVYRVPFAQGELPH